MEPETADPPASDPIRGHGVGGRCRGQARVEPGVEASHLGHSDEQAAHGVDPGQGRWVVQRSQFIEASEFLADTIVDQHCMGEA